MIWALIVVITLLSVLSSGAYVKPSVWPQPSTFEAGSTTIQVSNLKFTSSAKIDTLNKAFSRYSSLIFTHQVTAAVSGNSSAIPAVTTVEIKLESDSEAYPQLDTDESYTLTIPATASESITISANNVYGALRGLESLSQLIVFDFESEQYLVTAAPISISDSPRYQHRGLLLDTSRHYQPMQALKRTVDALAYSKYNVLHWHIVDTQSFPFQSSTYPKLWQGAYSAQERYTQADVRELVEYARLRGVKVMIEFDMPGHAGSWCQGYPEICPSATCKEPLDPSNDKTFSLIDSLLSECTGREEGGGLFPYHFLHLGGDEVNYKCWEASAHIKEWEAKQGFAGSEDTYEFFVDKSAAIARSQARTPVQWVEVFEHFGNKLDNNTVVHIWKDKSTLNGVLQAGYRALLSDNDRWYLDALEVSWLKMYQNEPTEGLSPNADPKLILGGESCMWGETVDPSDLDSTVWPRAAAVGERLWTPLSSISDDMAAVEDRLETFRCLLTQRGIAAAPVTNTVARYAPRNPGSCYAQRRKL